MRKENRKKATVAVASLAALGLIAGAIAVFTTNFSVTNKFKVEQTSAKFEETFTPPMTGQEIFGQKFAKSGKVDNTGTAAVKARVKITAGWYQADGITPEAGKNKFTFTDSTGATKTGDAATLVFNEKEVLNGFADVNSNYACEGGNTDTTDKSSWVYDNGDKYFYYGGTDGEIAANTTSAPILKEVKFNADLKDSKTTKGYYLLNAAGEVIGSTSYPDQDAAVAAMKANANAKSIKYQEETAYSCKDYDGLTYIVKLDGEIKGSDGSWTN